MNLKLLAADLIEKVRRHGPTSAARKAVKYLLFHPEPDAFDAQFGVNTSGIVPLWRLRIASPNARFGVQYGPSNVAGLRQAVHAMRLDPAGFTFIDLGCGKGRMLIVAGQIGFQSLVGVEFSPELAAIARDNVQRAGIKHCQVVVGDAAEFEFPDAELLVYLYNPFGSEVMGHVIRRMLRHRRRIVVVYIHPKCADCFDRSSAFRLIDVIDGETQIKIWEKLSGDPTVEIEPKMRD